jgi:hypothetical protein
MEQFKNGKWRSRDPLQKLQINTLLDLGTFSPFEISENVIYDPPHVSPRIRAQDGVLLAFQNPRQALTDSHYIEYTIPGDCRDGIRRELEKCGVFDKQLFPDLDGLARWLKFKVFDSFEEDLT